MGENAAQSEQFTGLILLTGIDKAGIAASLFETLAPFAVHVIDIEQIINNNRLILTVLIGASPAHQKAIEDDLAVCATTNEIDIATLFTSGFLTPVAHPLRNIHVSSTKLHPNSLAALTQVLTKSGANIERITRTSAEPVSISFTISGGFDLDVDLASLTFEDDTTVTVSEI